MFLLDASFASNQALEKLSRLGITSKFELLLHLPLRYEDETQIYPIANAPESKVVQVEGQVVHCEIVSQPRRQFMFQVEDESGLLHIRLLHFYKNQVRAYAVGKCLRLLGEIRQGYYGLEMIHPKCRVVTKKTPLADTLTPVYPTTIGLSQLVIRRLLEKLLTVHKKNDELFFETLPNAILKQYQLAGFRESIILLHNPPPNISIDALQSRKHYAWRRIKFDELLAQQLSMRLHYRQRRSRTAPALAAKNKLTKMLLASLTFTLTPAQNKSLVEISRDLASSHPMQRLLQGDVGSGKTIVAALAALQAIENGYQVAMMVPTEILAEQHLQKISTWFEPLGITIAWLFGRQKKKQRDAALTDIATGNAMLAIGTHTLFQEQIEFNQLGLAIIDEQHRFGVHQRLALSLKANNAVIVPHQLMMTATPIPRTLSMSYYADLDVSVINELPPGRSPVTTKLIAESRRHEIILRIREACCSGKQAYWVCPLIGESEALQLKTALETYEMLSQMLIDLNIGLVHGRLHAQEKSTVMEMFQKGEIQLLVATTVIEVGVDVPNASLMVIEHAERMGLSQLHQLRGRIGRGTNAGTCILMYQKPLSEIARTRLKIIFKHTDGFEIARQDLSLRGPGEFLGIRQSGLPMLRFADLEQDFSLLEATQSVADEVLIKYPQLAQQHLQRWLGKKNEYLRV